MSQQGGNIGIGPGNAREHPAKGVANGAHHFLEQVVFRVALGQVRHVLVGYQPLGLGAAHARGLAPLASFKPGALLCRHIPVDLAQCLVQAVAQGGTDALVADNFM